MRKHNEGYVLPLVLVVMVILSLVAVGVMSVSLHNLQAQKADIDRMQAQYAAQGELEVFLAKLDSNLVSLNALTTAVSDTSEAAIQAPVMNAIQQALAVTEGDVPYVKLAEENGIVWVKNDDGSFSCNVCVYATDRENQARIDCTILLEKVITVSGGVHFVEAPQIVYTSYEITSLGGADDA